MNSSCVVTWLLSTPKGHCALKEALCYLPDDMVGEFLERWRPAHVLIKAYRDGEIEVYGPDYVRVRTLRLGRCRTFPGHEIEAQQRVDALLTDTPYSVIHYPSNLLEISHPDDRNQPVPLLLAGAT